MASQPRIRINQSALRKLEQQATTSVEVPLNGSEADAMRAVKLQYKKSTGLELNDAGARNIVRQARGK
ncbi:hypothetical protein [Nocardia cyriacigeorgica]|uniref:hypothetical protein n=1 Tax=Nocardia cyriacigeorgica TaxID=135487 RepID=UPI002455A408|nr:hypothetical protein [Nocardia cyriacigeorgica]